MTYGHCLNKIVSLMQVCQIRARAVAVRAEIEQFKSAKAIKVESYLNQMRDTRELMESMKAKTESFIKENHTTQVVKERNALMKELEVSPTKMDQTLEYNVCIKGIMKVSSHF